MKHSGPIAFSLLVVVIVVGTTSAFVVDYGAWMSTNPKRFNSALFVAEPKQVKNKVTTSSANRVTPKSAAGSDESKKGFEFDKFKNAASSFWGDGMNSVFATKKNGNADAISQKPRPTVEILKALIKRPAENEAKKVPFKEPTPSRSFSVFDGFKGAMYGPAAHASKPAVKPLSKASPKAITVTDNNNPLQRFSTDIRETMRQQQQQVTNGIDKIKTEATAMGTFLTDTATEIQAVPGRVQSFVASIPVTINSITERAEQQAAAVKHGVEETVDKTLQVVEDVKALPTKVQQTVQDVKALPTKVQQTVADTKQSVKEAALVVEEVSTSAKVLLGLEKAKARPPKSLPPKEPVDLALEVAGSVLAGAGKVAWWVGSGALSALKEQLKEGEVAADPTQKKPAFLTSSVLEEAASRVVPNSDDSSTTEPIKPVAAAFAAPGKLGAKRVEEDLSKEDEKLNQEIAEALQLANEALSMVSSSPPSLSKSKSPEPVLLLEDEALNEEIAEALRLADEALAFVAVTEKKEVSSPDAKKSEP